MPIGRGSGTGKESSMNISNPIGAIDEKVTPAIMKITPKIAGSFSLNKRRITRKLRKVAN